MKTFNLYCDESCHLQKDGFDIMVLGTVACPANRKKDIYKEIREIKKKYGFKDDFEIKWTKVSDSKIEFYIDLIQYFIKNDDLWFRSIVSNRKTMTNITPYGSCYDDVYNKLYYYTFIPILDNIAKEYRENVRFNIYIDIKDTLGKRRLELLKNSLEQHKFYQKNICINKMSQVNSKKTEILQLADLLIGAVSYYNRYLSTNHKTSQDNYSKGKIQLIEELLEARYCLEGGSRYSENKFNVFMHTPSLKRGVV
ncbi:MAG: DUF3800 domain-containing protein [Clostridium celatum]|nr:DUF3800 domain-containing protein [Clostridium celatum]